MGRVRGFLVGLIALGVSACGDGLLPGTGYDQALLSFSGRVSPTGGLVQARRPIVSLLWTDPLQQKPDLPMPLGWMKSNVSTTGDTFAVAVFRPPPSEAMVDLSDMSGSIYRVAVAEIVIVDDQDGDGTFRVQGPRATIMAPDTYLAGAAHVLTYVATPYPSTPSGSPLTLPGQAGYAVVTYVCQGQLSGGIHEVPKQSVEIILQPSLDLPNVRSCRASHGP